MELAARRPLVGLGAAVGDLARSGDLRARLGELGLGAAWRRTTRALLLQLLEALFVVVAVRAAWRPWWGLEFVYTVK